MSDRSDHYFIYVKNKENKHTGITICVMQKDGKLWHGQATCGPKDQFNKATGRQISYERAMYEYERNKYERDRKTTKIEHSTWTEECPGSHNHVFQVEKHSCADHVSKVQLKTDKILDPNWTNHQELLATLTSDGNGITVTFDGVSTTFDYAQWAYIEMLRVIESETSKWKYNYTKGP